MLILLYVVHIMIALALIGVVMLQKSEGGALGMGGGGMSGFMTGRSTANLLTRTTAILAAAFFATSILLVVLSNYTRAPRSIIDEGGPPPAAPVGPAAPAAPVPATPAAPIQPAPVAPAQPAPPADPSAPLAK
jgi:preprotein translocase subunit SecG